MLLSSAPSAPQCVPTSSISSYHPIDEALLRNVVACVNGTTVIGSPVKMDQGSVSSSRQGLVSFHTLPTDLLIMVVHEWLAGDERELLQVLSKLTCSSSMACDDELLLLTSHKVYRKELEGRRQQHITSQWNAGVDDGTHAYSRFARDIPGLLRWLYCWAVPMKVLDLTAVTLPKTGRRKKQRRRPQLPCVDTIHLPVNSANSSVGWIFDLLPNLTAIHCNRRDKDSSTLWPVLKKYPSLKLNAFTTRSWANPPTMCVLLQAFGQHLQVLKVRTIHHGPTINMLQVMARHCPNLCSLEFEAVYCTSLQYLDGFCHASDVIELLVNCTALTDLSVCFRGGMADLHSILAHNQNQLKRLTIINCYCGHDAVRSIGHVTFGEIIAQHPQLDRYQFHAFCVFKRSTGFLHLATPIFYGMKDGALESILEHCQPIKKLLLLVGYCPPDETQLLLLTDAIKDSVVELELRALSKRSSSTDEIFNFAIRCPHLVKLVIDAECCGHLTDAKLQALAGACPQLQQLFLEGYGSADPTFTDAGMLALFLGCPKLKLLRIDMAYKLTFCTLQAIVDCRLRLETFTMGCIMLEKNDFLQFRQLAKKAGLIPVPKIVEHY